MPRFAILDHDHPLPHWDFLLESEGVLRAWRLLREPCRDRVIAAEPLPDHRLLYLDYEGPVSGGRGHVQRWDGGAYSWETDTRDEIRVQLSGERVRGTIVLSRTADGQWSWLWR